MDLKISNQNINIDKRTSKLENTIFLNILSKLENNIEENIILETNDFKKLSSQDIQVGLQGLMGKYISYSYTDSDNNSVFTTFPHISFFTQTKDIFYISVPPMIINAFKKNSVENFISLKTFFYFRKKSSHNFFNLVLKNSSENINLLLTIDELKEIFNVKDESYDRFFDFEKALLKPLVENINSYSNYTLIYNKIKKGESKNNKVTAIEFILKNNSIIEKSAETNYLIQLIKSNVKDYKKIWESINSSINEIGFIQCKRAILFLKENNLTLSDDELINYLKRKGENIEEILQLNNHTLIKEKISLYKDVTTFTKTIYNIMIGYNFYYSLNFKFLKDIKEFKEGDTFFYRDENYIVFGTYIENRGSFKIFQTQG
ncbi:replication initiation protein [Cetobacterium somerae]|uniref:replication initiation protein n=1 Tax=Cetobacterium sp. NK01 TaxID=2993530 RepID=UPI0021169E4A|nr:replication initiation protein [Cetobacterium sp. NK01]MCQ8212227.1 replication initiation protein [Cetobacterium sp. NK01]